jgi:hypothetical protein
VVVLQSLHEQRDQCLRVEIAAPIVVARHVHFQRGPDTAKDLRPRVRHDRASRAEAIAAWP